MKSAQLLPLVCLVAGFCLMGSAGVDCGVDEEENGDDCTVSVRVYNDTDTETTFNIDVGGVVQSLTVPPNSFDGVAFDSLGCNGHVISITAGDSEDAFYGEYHSGEDGGTTYIDAHFTPDDMQD